MRSGGNRVAFGGAGGENERMKKRFLQVLRGEESDRVPLWMMRQAGRYLPEYREIRAGASGFLDLVYDPDLACEITLQPIRRFGMDAAILFSDILVVPDAMGCGVRFVDGEGPVLDPVRSRKDFEALRPFGESEKPERVYESVRRIRAALEAEGFHETALIGFSGAPWTLACYMIEGGGSRDFQKARSLAYRDPGAFLVLIDLLSDAVIAYLAGQARAGAEALQIFDSWAGVLAAEEFRRWVIAPTRRIVAALRAEFPDVPVIGFPKGAGPSYPLYVGETGVSAVSLDHNVSTRWAAEAVQTLCPVQGNLDPVCLLAGGVRLDESVGKILSDFSGKPFVFNLGHGIDKATPPEHVQRVVEYVQNWQN